MAHLTKSDIVDIVRAFTEDLEPMISIAKRYNKTRQGIYRVLKKQGVNTSKGLGNTRIAVSCDYCQKTLIINRARLRNQKRTFCNMNCYYAFIEHNQGLAPYKESRHGQRLARLKVSTVFDLQPGNIIHHIDRNCFNNRWDNLMVFATQGDHLRYHRLGKDYAQPIWRGDMSMPEFKIDHIKDEFID